MKKGENKAKEIVKFLDGLTDGRYSQPNVCATCPNEILEDSFRDELSRKEYKISGMCQKCQDSVFGA